MNVTLGWRMFLTAGFLALQSAGCAEEGDMLSDDFASDEVVAAAELASENAPFLLAGTFGADNINGLFACAGNVLDGLPVVFSEPINPTTVSPSDFTVINAQGAPVIPLCATLAPAINADEMRTVLLQGDFGNATGQDPQSVQISGNILTASGTGDFALSTSKVTPFSVGQYLVYARSLPLPGNVGGADQCPVTTSSGVAVTRVVQLAFGSNAGANFPNTPAYRSRFHVRLSDGTEVSPLAFGDTTIDNYLELCLGSNAAATSVRVDAFTVQDASGQQNQVDISVALEN